MYRIFGHPKQMAFTIAIGAAKFRHAPPRNGTHRISQRTFRILPTRPNRQACYHFAVTTEVVEVPMHFFTFPFMALNAFRKVCLGGADIHVIPCIKMHHAFGSDFKVQFMVKIHDHHVHTAIVCFAIKDIARIDTFSYHGRHGESLVPRYCNGFPI